MASSQAMEFMRLVAFNAFGPQSPGEHFLLTGARITAQEGKALWFVSPRLCRMTRSSYVLERSLGQLLSKNPQMLRFF